MKFREALIRINHRKEPVPLILVKTILTIMMKMRISGRLLSVALLIWLLPVCVLAGPGDTTFVQTFTFGSPQEGKFLFPDSTRRWSKIKMYYTLKCNPNQSPACGEWDYLTYTYLYKHTGRFDSTRYSHTNFTIDGVTPDSLMLMHTPSYEYHPYFEYSCITPPTTTAQVGIGTAQMNSVFSTPGRDARTQCLWTKNELLYAGLHQGLITGMRFRLASLGTGLKKLVVRLKATSLDSLNGESFAEGPFTEVFRRDFKFADTGWQTLPFTFPFSWNASSNILVDICFEDHENDSPNTLAADTTPFTTTLFSDARDNFLRFHDLDYVKIPASAFASVDSAITVAFWLYGDSILQPQNNTVFEGVNSKGNRVVNAHVPWGDGTVYWDAGGDSTGYDRLYKQIDDASLYRGKWNHWAFVKNSKSRKMKIYCNGTLIRISSGPMRRMNGISEFRIGSNAQGNDVYYDGYIDDFSVWKRELSDTAIRAMMYRDISLQSPYFSDLVAYYKFNDGNGLTTRDDGPLGHTAALGGYPEWKSPAGVLRFRNAIPFSLRPAVIFEQGMYDPANLDSVFRIDTVAKSPVMVVLYGDSLSPYLPTDTLTEWPAYYHNYVYDSEGVAVDSSLVSPDEVLFRKDMIYYGEPFEVLERFELARFITPYGNGLSLGDGWTWIYDLTDYAPLLRDSVHLSAGNWQELLDMRFEFIEGIPPRDVLAIQNIYTGTHGYANESQHNLPPVKVGIGQDVINARLKVRITGHGFGGTLNCSEFCPRTNLLFINGVQAYSHEVWRKCGINALYPQGGTWLYDRAAWCPGAEVSTSNFELTPFLHQADSLTIDYDLQTGYTWDGQGSWPYYQIESQLVTYSKPNFSFNVSMEEIIAPDDHELYNRFNPVCGNPVIAIRNNGKEDLNRCEITYGPVGGKQLSYMWNGTLGFQDTAVIKLPPVDWSDWTGGDNRFIFEVKNPNDKVDEYPSDNGMTSHFDIPPMFDNLLRFEFKTNHMAGSLSWVLEDQNGQVLYQNGELENNTVYLDTFNLQTGCYKLTIRNAEGEGLKYWANMPPYGNGTAGYAQIMNMDEQLVKKFQGDFGSLVSQSFTVGVAIDLPGIQANERVGIYPIPSDGVIFLDTRFDKPVGFTANIFDAFGKEIRSLKGFCPQNTRYSIDLSGEAPGVYILELHTDNWMITRKLILY